MDSKPTLAEFLVLGTLEVLLNQAVNIHADGRSHLAALSGKVVRVRAWSPDFIFYCLVDADGIQLTTDYEGDAHVRVRGGAGSLLYRALMPAAERTSGNALPDDDFQIDGEPATVDALRAALDTFNLWDALRTWLRDHVAMPEVFGMLRQQDPAWLERLQDMPQLVAEVIEDLRRQREIQSEILSEVRSLRESLRSERRTDIVCITAGMLLFSLALLTLGGQFPLLSDAGNAARDQALALAALGIALMMSRMFGKRYGH